MSKELEAADARVEIQVLKIAFMKMDRALKLSHPEGARGEVFELWNEARRLAGLPYLVKVEK